MDERLSYAEIEARYAPAWVLIGDLESDEDLNVLSGRVLFHGPDHDEVWRKAEELRPGHFAVFYFGPFPDDMEFLL